MSDQLKQNLDDVQAVAVALAGIGGVAFIVDAARTRRKRNLREQVFLEYNDGDSENVDLSDAFLLARTKRGLKRDEKVNALETGDAPHESPTDVTTEANDVKTPVQSKKTDYAKETNGAKKRMRRFNWLTITGAFLILLAAAIAWTPVGKIIPRQYSPRNIAVVDQSTATNVVEDIHEQVVDIENALPIADAIPGTVEVAENKEVISDAELEPVTHEQEKKLSVDEDATVGSEAASSPVATFESRTVSVQETSASRAKVYEDILIPISEIKIGDRTLGLNPQGADGDNGTRFAETPHYIYSLRYIKENGTACNIKLLRPADWLNSVAIRYCNNWTGRPLTALDFTIAELAPDVCPIELGVEVWLELDEMGCVGWAKLVAVDTRFRYKPGEGNLVTGTFQHEVGDAVDLYVEGQDEPIGVTETHPFWSVDRQDFVPVGELVEGERLLLFNGETKRVAQKLPRPGPECVYNLEILGEHVYLVTLDGIYVHNQNCANGVSTKQLRKTPGVATGSGKNDGLVAEVAQRLSGRTFKSFNHFRREFWRTVYDDPYLIQKYGLVFKGKRGNTPLAPANLRQGKRIKYELHHIEAIKDKGFSAVYDLDNLKVVDPLTHIGLHK